MSPAAELLATLLPPLTFSSDRLVVAAVLEPCYTVGGDAFDYAVDGSLARLLVLDAMGRGLDAGLTAATALAAIRGARRDGHGLYAMARAADEAIRGQFGNAKFATAVLAELDLDVGVLRYLNAGHPPPLVLRRGKAVRFLDGGRRLPLGMDDAAIEVAQERLEPGDGLLLYTDGITEARAPDGEQFGVERLVDLAERHAVEGLAAPEKLRRLAHSVLAHQHGPAGDDATLMLLEWSKAAASRTASMTAVRREL
jgi:serine phosphatase RsbU (regulator of sigma subunit)